MNGREQGYRRVFDAPDWMKREARKFADDAAYDLGLPWIRIEFWEPASPHAERLVGWTNDALDVNERRWSINLVPSQLKDVDQLSFAVYHESRHLWQFKNSMYFEEQQAEADADQYAYKKTRIIFGFDRRPI